MKNIKTKPNANVHTLYLYLLVLTSILVAAAFTTAGTPPEFCLKKLDGGEYKLSEDLGKSVIILEFWGMCCRARLGKLKYLDELYKQYKDKGLKVYAINVDDAASGSRVKPVIKRYDYAFPVLLDPLQNVLRKFSPSKIKPYTVIIGRNGDIIHALVDNTGNDALVEKIIREQFNDSKQSANP